ncbi:hypothetical protein C9374_003298 [Naegleria lovaniensis]|uniref:Uncharacterized protein n=1 Tax=Naegleria lovaniensis TaxID=51637 RepID=A0AA88GSZ9_NAELO|nr:uncharacterized protein C9374_003298 [Naegleria lovaniensis]KAG2385483.1 hypothetical protein C9374_003298 [Naegleria lovaniensis]
MNDHEIMVDENSMQDDDEEPVSPITVSSSSSSTCSHHHDDFVYDHQIHVQPTTNDDNNDETDHLIIPPVLEFGSLIPGIPKDASSLWTEKYIYDIGIIYRKMMIQVDAHRFERNFKLAHDELIKAINLFPYQPEAYYKRALIYFQTNNPKEMQRAINITKFVCRGHPFWSLLCEGYTCEVEQNFTKSRELYDQAYHVPKERILTFYENTFNVSKQCATSLYDLFDVFSPFFAIFNEGCVMMDLQIEKEAINTFQSAIDFLENSAKNNVFHFLSEPQISKLISMGKALCFNNMGCCALQFSTDHEALKYLCKGIEYSRKYVLVYENRMNLFSKLTMYASAVKDCDTVLSFAKNPDTLEKMHAERVVNIHRWIQHDAESCNYTYKDLDQLVAELLNKYPKNHVLYLTKALIAVTLDEAVQVLTEGINMIDTPAVDSMFKLASLLDFRSSMFEGMGETRKSNNDMRAVNRIGNLQLPCRIE